MLAPPAVGSVLPCYEPVAASKPCHFPSLADANLSSVPALASQGFVLKPRAQKLSASFGAFTFGTLVLGKSRRRNTNFPREQIDAGQRGVRRDCEGKVYKVIWWNGSDKESAGVSSCLVAASMRGSVQLQPD